MITVRAKVYDNPNSVQEPGVYQKYFNSLEDAFQYCANAFCTIKSDFETINNGFFICKNNSFLIAIF